MMAAASGGEGSESAPSGAEVMTAGPGRRVAPACAPPP